MHHLSFIRYYFLIIAYSLKQTPFNANTLKNHQNRYQIWYYDNKENVTKNRKGIVSRFKKLSSTQIDESIRCEITSELFIDII